MKSPTTLTGDPPSTAGSLIVGTIFDTVFKGALGLCQAGEVEAAGGGH